MLYTIIYFIDLDRVDEEFCNASNQASLTLLIQKLFWLYMQNNDVMILHIHKAYILPRT